MARNNSRFNRLLNFIGLVDESDDRDVGYDDNRPQGAATYNPPTRRGQASPPPRPVRGQDDTDARYQGRSGGYYDDRYQATASRYQQEPPRDYRQGRDAGYQAPRSIAQPSRRQPDSASQRLESYARQDSYQSRASSRQQPATPRQQPAPRYDDYPPQGASRYDQQPSQRARRDEAPPVQDNVVHLSGGGNRTETVLFFLHRLDECSDVIMALIDNKSVLLNLEDMDERTVQRGIDMLSGAAFALNATIRQASEKTYLIAPKSVSVESGSKDERY